jgi:hypothetical protein
MGGITFAFAVGDFLYTTKNHFDRSGNPQFHPHRFSAGKSAFPVDCTHSLNGYPPLRRLQAPDCHHFVNGKTGKNTRIPCRPKRDLLRHTQQAF